MNPRLAVLFYYALLLSVGFFNHPFRKILLGKAYKPNILLDLVRSKLFAKVVSREDTSRQRIKETCQNILGLFENKISTHDHLVTL